MSTEGVDAAAWQHAKDCPQRLLAGEHDPDWLIDGLKPCSCGLDAFRASLPDGKPSAWEPPTLTDEERALRDFVAECAASHDSSRPVALQPFMCERVVRLIDRLAPPPVRQEEDGQ